MRHLLWKNWLLHRKNIILGIVFAVFFSTITIDGAKYYTVSLMMCPALIFSWTVGKICYMEDSIATKQFLLSLPVSKWEIIFEKNIVSYFCIIVGLLIANIDSVVIAGFKNMPMNVSWEMNMIMACFLIFYNTIYIFLNYWFDYSKIRFVPYIILFFMFVFFKFGNEMIEIVSSEKFIFYILLIGISVLFNYFAINLAAKKPF